jgi:hypothetical protein
MPEELIDFVTPMDCPFCEKISVMVGLTIDASGEDVLETGTMLVSALSVCQLMKHVRDQHPDKFVPTFSRFPEDVIPEAEALLKRAGVSYVDTTAYAVGGAIQTTIHNN